MTSQQHSKGSFYYREGERPLSADQQRLWVLHQLTPISGAQNVWAICHLSGLLDLAALRQSVDSLVQRHRLLRSFVREKDGHPFLVTMPAAKVPLSVVEFEGTDQETNKEASIWAWVDEKTDQPFDLTQGPLVRTCLLRLGNCEHVLMLAAHRMVCDSSSLGIYLREIGLSYQAYFNGLGQKSPSVPQQDAGDSFPHQIRVDEGNWQNDLLYWKQRLGGELPFLELPTDRPRPRIQSCRKGRQLLRLDRDFCDSLERLNQQEGVTSFVTLLAALQTLLHRYSGQEDVLVGSNGAGCRRTRAKHQGSRVVSRLVLRTDVSGEPSFRDLLGRVSQIVTEASAHQNLPFENLMEELKPNRILSHNPLFQVMFNWEAGLLQLEIYGGITFRTIAIEQGLDGCDFSLSISEFNDGLQATLLYDAELFDTPTARRLLGHWQTILQSAVADPGQRLWQLPLLNKGEWHEVVVRWNQTMADYPKDESIQSLFETQVEKTPDALALVFHDRVMSFRELNVRANQLAHYLLARGVRPEAPVGLYLPHSFELAIGMLAIFKAGGVYVPLDPTYPPERLTYMFTDAQVRILLTQADLADRFRMAGSPVICMDADLQEIDLEPEHNPSQTVTSANLAYIIYTSGSTGKPKGVAVEQKQLLNRLAWMWRIYPFGSDEVQCLKSSVNFIDSFVELLGALLQGVKVVILPIAIAKDPYELVRALSNHRVTRAWVVPSLLNTILNTHDDLRQLLPRLKICIIGGEALSSELCRRFLEQIPHCQLFNGYGQSETFAVCWYETRNLTPVHVRVPIGRPVANVQVYVLDRHLQPVPVGVPGELHVATVGLARGYLNQPELTAEKFIPNPFGAVPNSRLYKTGDLARWLPDGNLDYLGRTDHQVKVRGFRVELAEIEAVLSQHTAVSAAVALVREDKDCPKELVAYVTSNRQIPPLSSDLRAYLRERLPEHMIPSAVVVLRAIPLAPNGKIDRRALPPPDRARLGHDLVPARNSLERAVSDIWQKVLGQKPV